jgi:methylglutaconyl-CoA hydratase
MNYLLTQLASGGFLFLYNRRMKEVQTQDLLSSEMDGPVLYLRLNRPEVHNALNVGLIAELTAVFTAIPTRDDVRVVVLGGNGRSFCAGADLAYMRDIAAADFAANAADAEGLFDLMLAIDRCPRPVIGRVHGAAIGGGVGLVSCCDIVIAAERASFAFSEVRLGVVPAVISPFVLRKIGAGQARRLFLSGERFDAAHAQTIGLVHEVVSAEALDDRVAHYIEQILAGAPGAQAAAKALINAVDGRSPGDVRDFTSRLIAERRAGVEGQEGMSAFLQKRKPAWRAAADSGEETHE